jgi:hypothetical protein
VSAVPQLSSAELQSSVEILNTVDTGAEGVDFETYREVDLSAITEMLGSELRLDPEAPYFSNPLSGVLPVEWCVLAGGMGKGG